MNANDAGWTPSQGTTLGLESTPATRPPRARRAWLAKAIAATTAILIGLGTAGITPAWAEDRAPGEPTAPNWSPVVGHKAALAQTCSDALFIGARGSGEKYAENEGLGPMVQTVRNGLKETTSVNVKVRQVAIDYPAYHVEPQVSVPSLAADLKLAFDLLTTGQAHLIEQGLYLFSVDLGVTELQKVIDDSLSRCEGKEKIILAGYSAGALVVHKALAKYPSSTAFKGVALIADPARDTSNPANRSIVNYGGTPIGNTGIYSLATQLSSTAFPPSELPSNIRQVTVEVCSTSDPVCDVDGALGQESFSWLTKWESSLGTISGIHTGYGQEGSQVDARTLHGIGALLSRRLSPEPDTTSNYSDTPIERNFPLNLNRSVVSMAVDSTGTRYAVDGLNIVWRFPAGSADPSPWAQIPWLNGRAVNAASVTVDWADNVYVHDPQNQRIVKITSAGRIIPDYMKTNSGSGPIAADRAGNLYLAEYASGTIRKISLGGTNIQDFAVTSGRVNGLAVSLKGNVYTANDPNPPFSGQREPLRLNKITPDGTVNPGFATIPTEGTSGWSGKLAVDSRENVYSTDTFGNRVFKISPTGTVVPDYAQIGANRYGGPLAITVDAYDVVSTINMGSPDNQLDSVTELTPVVKTEPLEFSTAPVPVIEGEPVSGQTLTARAGSWLPVPTGLSYQWFRNGTAIVGESSGSLVLGQADVGSQITVAVTASRDGYANKTTTSAPTAAIQAPPPLEFSAAPVPVIEGEPVSGRTLTARAGSWEPVPAALSYQWFRNGTAIAGASSVSLVLGQTDVGSQISVAVTASRDGYQSEVRTSEPTPGVALGTLVAGTPVVSGSARVGETLSASPGTWTDGTAFEYQWLADGVELSGATEPKLVLEPQHAGEPITVRVTGSKTGYKPEVRTSEPTPGVALGTLVAGTPVVSGSARVGETLSASPGTWTDGTAFEYQWLADGVELSGATEPKLVLEPQHAGEPITVRVTGSKTGYKPEVRTSEPTPGVALAALSATAPALTGTQKVGYTITATPGTWTTETTLNYQWYRSGIAIPGATTLKWSLTAADYGKRMKLRVTGSKPGYATLSKDSFEGVPVAAGTLTGPTPLISGTKKVGYVLTASPGIWTNGTALKYQWYRSGVAIIGATGPRLTLIAADAGKTIKVRVTGSKAGYISTFKDSAQTSAVALGTLLAPTPRITGTLRSGYVLTANPGTWTYGTALKYQWYRSGVAITGATGRTYRIVAADRYDTIRVRVVGSKAGYISTARYSASTSRVP